MTRRRRPTRQTELGLEVMCQRCKEFFPADREFFYMSGGSPHSWCIACYVSDPNVHAKRQRAVAKLKLERARRFDRLPTVSLLATPNAVLWQLPRGFFRPLTTCLGSQ